MQVYDDNTDKLLKEQQITDEEVKSMLKEIARDKTRQFVLIMKGIDNSCVVSNISFGEQVDLLRKVIKRVKRRLP